MSRLNRMDSISYLSSEEEEDDDDDDDETDESSCESDDSSSQQTSTFFSPNTADSDKLEAVSLGNVRLALPQGLCENELVFNEFFSLDTWKNVLSEQQREELKKYLPKFPVDNEKEREETVNRLFKKKNFKFGNPLNQLFSRLHNGFLRPDIVKMRSLMKRAQHHENRYRKRKLHHQTLKSLLVARRRLLVAASSEPPDTPPKVERLLPPPRTSHSEQRARRRYFEEIMHIRKAQGENSQSSEDENYPEGPPPRLSKKQKKQLMNMEMSLSPELAPLSSTLNASLATPFQLESQVTCTFNPYEITEESYKTLLAKHKKRRSISEDDPELNIIGINLQDVSQRSQTARRTPIRLSSSQGEVANPSRSKKKIKVEPTSTPPPTFNPTSFNLDRHDSPSLCSEDSCSISFPDMVETGSDVVDKTPVRLPGISPKRRSSAILPSPVLYIKEEMADEDDYEEEEDDDEEEEEQTSQLVEQFEEIKPIKIPEFSQYSQLNNHVIPAMPATVASLPTNSCNHLPMGSVSFKAADMNPSESMDLHVKLEEATVPVTPPPIKAELELTQDTHVCFLSLVRDIICSTPDQRMGLAALEQRLRGWQESPISPLNDWYSLAPSWVNLLPSAVNFLSGDFPAETQPEDFVPYLEYKPHMHAYQWIGAGRDSDHHLMPLCSHWLERRNEVPTVPIRKVEHTEEHGLTSPPPSRCPTTWQVRKAMGPERENFHQQEKRRYENPHRAFTYRMHGYESIVGPVKGACALGSGLTKPRGHTLLVPDRPNYVTILSLVRDAVARLPNGEGSRSDICELLRDSQYLVTGAEEGYLQSVVGGALDRLHFEVDTCVKYDPKRKIWVYLHRNRSEEEFERLHQQQSVQPKAKRPSVPRKTARPRTKDKEVKPMQVVTTALATVLTPGRLQETTNLPTNSPTRPSPMAPVKASPVATSVPRTFTLSSGALQNLQVATSTGVQTIQVSGAPAVAGGTSLLTSSAGQTVKLTAAANKKGATNLSSITSSGLTQQALAAARLMVSGGGSITVNKPLQTVAQGQIPQAKTSPGTILLHSQSQLSNASGTPTTSAPLVLHPITSQSRTITAASQASAKTLLASVNSAQLVNVSQMQLVNAARAIQQQQTEALQSKQVQKQIQRQQQLQKKRQLQQQIQFQIQQQKQQILEQQLQHIQDHQTLQGTKTVASTMAAGVKLLNAQAAVKGSVSPMHGTQAIFIKHSGVGSITMPTVSSCTTPSSTSLKNEITHPLQQAGASSSGSILISKAGSIVGTDVSTLTTQASTVVSVTVSSPSTNTIMASRQHGTIVTTSGGKPMVAKVLTNAQGQLISMESLLAHQKQQLAAATAGTARMVGARPQQPHLIQLPGTGGVAQFAMVAPSGLAPRLLQAAAQQLSQQQGKSLAATSGLKIVTTGNTTAGTSGSQVATSLNMATIGGQPVILASKGQSTMAGQNVYLTSSAGGSPAVVLASSAGFRTQQGGTLLLQSGTTQQILLPHGFQAGTLNLKSLQGLQGIRVIPLAQASAAAANTSMPRGRQQVYARIITPSNKVHTPTSSTSSADGGAPTANEGPQ